MEAAMENASFGRRKSTQEKGATGTTQREIYIPMLYEIPLALKENT